MEMTTPELDQVYQTAVDNYMSEHPDVEIEYEFTGPEDATYSEEYDNQIQKAIEILNNK